MHANHTVSMVQPERDDEDHDPSNVRHEVIQALHDACDFFVACPVRVHGYSAYLQYGGKVYAVRIGLDNPVDVTGLNLPVNFDRRK
jgi:hypothetical protein